MSKKMEFDAFLASSKEAFTVEMKDTFAGFRSEFSTWKNSITPATISLQATVAEVRENVTALSDEIRGNITALSETVKSLDKKVTRENVTTLSDEIPGNITTLSETVQTLDNKVNWAHGHVTETALTSLSLRLDILEQRATCLPLDVAR